MMNRYFATLFLASSLFWVQSCSKIPSATQSSQTSSSAISEPQSDAEDHSMDMNDPQHHRDHHNASQPASHENHDHHQGSTASKPATQTQAKLTLSPTTIQPNQPVSVLIEIQDSAGKAVKEFDSFQEQLMHLIVVSDDLEFFSHLHPTYQNDGKFVVKTPFPKPGNYSLYSDYKPKGEPERVSVLKTSVAGTVSASPKIEFNRIQTIRDTKVNLNLSQGNLKAGKPATLTFELQDTATNQPATNLQPYLGEMGHLVILKQSENLSETDYIHAHPLKNTPTHQVQFMTQFPEPGNYKLWGQFNRSGKIITADFWINVK
jgi:hypothetical protein